MQIDFFVNACKSTSNNNEFGLCDDPAPANNAAYIDEKNKSNWIGIVKNVHNYEIEFIAIDNCIDIRKPDGSLESRCDGLLNFENNLIFVELKCRGYGQWLKKGREQLANTINIFKLHYDISQYNVVFGNVCNSLKPQSHVGHATNIQQFYDATGFVLKSDRIIEIQA